LQDILLSRRCNGPACAELGPLWRSESEWSCGHTVQDWETRCCLHWSI